MYFRYAHVIRKSNLIEAMTFTLSRALHDLIPLFVIVQDIASVSCFKVGDSSEYS